MHYLPAILILMTIVTLKYSKESKILLNLFLLQYFTNQFNPSLFEICCWTMFKQNKQSVVHREQNFCVRKSL